MKTYTVYFIIKKNNHGYLHEKTVEASNQKEAIKLVRDQVPEECGRNAFHCTCKKPIRTKDGMEMNGIIYTKYSEVFNMLW
jgi:hypothetical protein